MTLENAPQIVTVGQSFAVKVRVTNPLTNDNSAERFNVCYSTNGDLNTQSATLTTPDGVTVTLEGASRCVSLPDEVALQLGESLLITWSVIADYVASPKTLAATASARVNNLSGWGYGTGDADQTTFQIVAVQDNPALTLSFESGYVDFIYIGSDTYLQINIVNSGSSIALGTELCLSSDQDVILDDAIAPSNAGQSSADIVNGCIVFDAPIGDSTVVFHLIGGSAGSASVGTISASVYHPADATPDDNNVSGSFWVAP